MSHARTTYPDIQVRAEAIKLFVDAFSVFPSIAAKYLDRLSWSRESQTMRTSFMSLDAWLRVLKNVLADVGPNAVFQMGQRVIHNPNFSPATRKLDEALRQIDVAYHKSHRKGGLPMFNPGDGSMLEGIGHYAVTSFGERPRIHVVCDTPYPCPLEHGIVAGVATRFQARAVVAHESADSCRMSGGPRCTYSVCW